ncbi:MAG: MBL fold metallo-hydrolase [Deltaproteobacteria bacterium]|nr:MBL fold metallo-hydrolase [Deltaproteobacteria bacterium]
MHSHEHALTDWQQALGRFHILLPGIPAVTSRGWLAYCTTVLFRLKGHWALYDTGHYSDRSQLLAALAKVQVRPDEIYTVILSHLHFDHVLNLPLFGNATVVVAQAELDYARDVAAGTRQDHAIPETWPALLKDRNLHVVDGSAVLDDGMEAVVLPGHTPGCLVLFCDAPVPVALCGDALKNAWELFSPASVVTPVDDAHRLAGIAAIRARAQVVIPGHDRPFGMVSGGLCYLSGYDFTITGDLFPEPRNRVLLDLPMTAGLRRRPEK